MRGRYGFFDRLLRRAPPFLPVGYVAPAAPVEPVAAPFMPSSASFPPPVEPEPVVVEARPDAVEAERGRVAVRVTEAFGVPPERADLVAREIAAKAQYYLGRYVSDEEARH